jgi:D-alanine-D-alanine ligase
MEVNSLAGLNPKRSDLPILCNLLGMSYPVLISSIIESALRRADINLKILH